jgi:hypothetical protein
MTDAVSGDVTRTSSSAVPDTPGEGLLRPLARRVVRGDRRLGRLAVPRPLSGVYYLLRPLRLAAQYVRRAIRTD